MTLDDDVAIAVERLRRQRGMRLKALVNEALREGLRHMEATSERSRDRFDTEAVDLGPLRIGSLDSIAEAIAVAEDESFT